MINNVTTFQRFTTDSFVLVDALVGYDLGVASAQLEGWEAAVNVANLFDKRYIAALGSGQFFNTAASLNNTMQAGSPRQVFGTIRRRF